MTDSTGTFLVKGVEPGTTLVIKETRAKPGYLLDDTPQTVQVKEGQTVTVEFRNQPMGNLIIHKLSSKDKAPLEEYSSRSPARTAPISRTRAASCPPMACIGPMRRARSSSPASPAQWL